MLTHTQGCRSGGEEAEQQSRLGGKSKKLTVQNTTGWPFGYSAPLQ